MYSNEKRFEFIRLRALGWSYRKIAEKLILSYDTVLRWAALYKDQIHNFRLFELDALKEYAFVAKYRRIEALGGIVNVLVKNLENKKKLEKLSPKENLDGLAKYINLLRMEDSDAEPEFKEVPPELPPDPEDEPNNSDL